MTFSMPYFHTLLLAALLFTIAAASTDGFAGQGSATLTEQDGQLILLIDLPKPPPVNLIAQLKLRSQAQITAATPKAAKIDKEKSVVKWLVKNPQPGKLRFSVKTSAPVSASSASAVVTYRKPGDGSLITIEAANN